MENGVVRAFHYQKFDAGHFENTILNGVVRFTRPSDFNDPWDCQPVFSVPENKDERAALVQWMATASANHDAALDLSETARRVEKLIADPQALRHAMDQAAPEMLRQLDRHYRVYCLTTKPACPRTWVYTMPTISMSF